MRKTFIYALSCLCVVLMACGTAFAQQALPAGNPVVKGKIQSGPYHGAMGPMTASDAPDAAPFYSNLVVNTCTGCNYSTDNGFFILGPNNCFSAGATQWIAYPFVAARSGAVKRVSVSVTDSGFCVATSLRFTVAIYSDACTGTPGTQIGTAVVVNAPAAPCALAAANFGHAGVTLTAGITYWVVVTTDSSPQQIGTTAIWWMANTAEAPFNLNDGNGWIFNPDGAPGGFSVQ
ncbi:MAG TPA: choice-of-anchor R domain-containing protein [Candidatus Udaeobacter sp.]|jgi:hypothetical protein